MFVDVDEYVHTMTELGINSHQFLLCYLLYTDQKLNGSYPSTGKEIANLYKYATKACKWDRKDVDLLIEKGYLEDNYTGDKTHPDYLTVTDLFVDKIFIRENKFAELWEAYPFTV